MSDDKELDSRARKGTFWFIAGYGGAQVLRFAGNLILSRLLFEEAFGLMAIVMSIMQGLGLFSDIGIFPSIVQSEREDAEFLNTAWTLQVGRGVALTVISVAIAYPVADFYDAPEIAWLLPLSAIATFVAGFESTKIASEVRALDLRRRELTALISQFASLFVMVVWALISPSVVALVSGGIAGAFVRVMLSHFYFPGPINRFGWERPAAVELVRFGRWVVFSTLIHFVSSQSDRLILGKLLAIGTLGVYHMGAVIARIPVELLGKYAFDVMFPVYSKVIASGGDLPEAFDRMRRPVFIFAAWALSGLLAGGPTAVQLLYDDRYYGAGVPVQWLAAAGWVYLVATTYSAMFLAHGKPKWITVGDIVKGVSLLGAVPLGFQLGERAQEGQGLVGALIGMFAADVLRYITTIALSLSRTGVWGKGLEFSLTVRFVVIGLAVAQLGTYMEAAELHVVLRSFVIFVVVTALWWPTLWPHVRERLEARKAASS